MRPVLFLSAAALAKALQAGERWVTVHPNGPGSKGQPILIQEQADGSAKVIGGAGGALTHLRLTGVKSGGDLKGHLAERAKTRREARKAQRERDKKLGIAQAKSDAHAQVTERTRQAHRDFVAGVAEAMGWSPEETTFTPPEGAPDEAVAAARQAHEQELVHRARKAVELNRQALLTGADEHAQAERGDLPLTTPDDAELSVADIDPVKAPTGLGFAPGYGVRAEARGADVKAEAQAFKAEPRGEGRGRKLEAAAALLSTPDTLEALKPKVVEAKAAMDLLRLDKKRRLAEQAGRDARRKIDEAIEAPKAVVADIDEARVDEAVAAEMEADLRTVGARAFLQAVNDAAPEPVKALRRDVGVGAYTAINALALSAGGDALVDRSVVDVLGVAGAAEVLARRLHADLPADEVRQLAEDVEAFHKEGYGPKTAAAVKRAQELQALAAKIELGAGDTGEDLGALQEANRRRSEAVNEARKVLGQALGETEANAALIYALKRGRSDKPLQVPLGSASVEDAVRQARAIGLERGDYGLETAGGVRVLTVSPQGLDRLAAPINRADLEQVRRNLDIIGGAQDEDGWLPEGFARRPDLGLDLKPGVAPTLARPFAPGGDLADAVRAYAGGRTADGDAPADIVADLQSADFLQRVGPERAAEYRAVLDELAPLADKAGKLRDPEALRPAFEGFADGSSKAAFGGTRTPLHRQTIPVDDTSAEALGRAFADEPTGPVAYKPVGDLTPQDQGALRAWFAANVAKASPEAQAARREHERLAGEEPERETEDMFGGASTNPDWTAWKARRDELAGQAAAGSTSWPQYIEAMGGPAAAYGAVQDLVRSRVAKSFAETRNRLDPAHPLKLGVAPIRGALDHLDAVDPKAREARLAKHRAMVDSLRDRVAGRYASGSVRDKLDAAREEEAGMAAAQMGFFADEPAPAAERALGADERHTLGQAAEPTLAAMAQQVGANFKPGQPVKLYKPTMSGGQAWARQRAIKYVAANKRAVLTFGTGSGKTAIGLGAFSHLHAQGAVKRGLFLVPSIAQGGFGADAARFLKPGALKGHVEPGASRESRLAAYRDPGTHFAVMTHQSFRDDMLHLGAQHAGVPEAEMGERVAAMSRGERKAWLQGVMRREGVGFDYLNVDEGHGILNRKGKENSRLADVIDAMGDTASHYINASADPVKNDVSEAFSLLQKMDPERYTDEAAFMRRYGVDTPAAKEGLRRELARFQYPSRIDPDIHADRTEQSVPLSPEQHEALTGLDRHVARARLARMQGEVDVDAVKAISPYAFKDVPVDQHEATARELQRSLGIVKEGAQRRIIDAHPTGGKLDAAARFAAQRKGKPGVIFAHSLDSVAALKARLEAEGHRVATITGKDSAKEKGEVIRRFNPDQGERGADIVVASDAGATGANLQSGRWLLNMDTPDTATTHAQRQGRINRIGQQHDIELADLVADHPVERRARERLKTKYELRDMLTSPYERIDDTGLAGFLDKRRIAREGASLL